jgi:hypothetical protein
VETKDVNGYLDGHYYKFGNNPIWKFNAETNKLVPLQPAQPVGPPIVIDSVDPPKQPIPIGPPIVEGAKGLWKPNDTLFYRDPWITHNGDFKGMIVATISARIIPNERDKAYTIVVLISSGVPLQSTPDKKGLPAGVNLGTESFMRKYPNNIQFVSNPQAVKATIGTPIPAIWPLPDLKLSPSVIDMLPDKKTKATLSAIMVSADFGMQAKSGAGQAKIEMMGINFDQFGKALKEIPEMRPIYLNWGFNLITKDAVITISQRGTPIENKKTNELLQ